MGFIIMPHGNKFEAVDASSIIGIRLNTPGVILKLSTGYSIQVPLGEEVTLESVAMAIERSKHLTSLTSWDTFSRQVLENPQY